MQQILALITQTRQIARDTYDFWVACPQMAQDALPGQFLHIRCDNHMLRRPISICEIDARQGWLRFVFAIRGKGTAWLAAQRAGQKLDILGPLGNGFPQKQVERLLLVGGGIGVPPLLESAKQCGKYADAILGFQTKDLVMLEQDFQQHCGTVQVTTDDGSYQRAGFVTNAMQDMIRQCRYNAVYACGPTGMLRAITQLSQQAGLPCHVSLEERMGCGVGACLVCACKIQKQQKPEYLHVCKDGPVFLGEEVVWE